MNRSFRQTANDSEAPGLVNNKSLGDGDAFWYLAPLNMVRIAFPLRAILVAAAVPLSGCSQLVYRCGQDISHLSTRKEVHRKFGEPTNSGIEKGEQFEEFRTRLPVYDEMGTGHTGMLVVYTFGLGEFLAFPHSLYALGQRVVTGGPEIRFRYDSAGNVTGISTCGHEMYFLKVGTFSENTLKSTEVESPSP